jgi:DNA-binding response OmpR family regulator
MQLPLLLAEGDTELREVYRGFLAASGYSVETAADGLECLAKVRRLTPVLLVLDRDLHWGGGDGVLAWLREQGITAGVPVVLTATGGCGPADGNDLRPPIVKVLPKPFALAALLNSVRAAVADHRQAESGPTQCAPLPRSFKSHLEKGP